MFATVAARMLASCFEDAIHMDSDRLASFRSRLLTSVLPPYCGWEEVGEHYGFAICSDMLCVDEATEAV
jgi:hypothetical protein